MKFSVGDKVRVRHGLKCDECYNGIHCNSKMIVMGGEVLTIKQINPCFYNVKENVWVWSDEMLEPVNENTKENENMNMRKVCYEIEDYKFNTETGETYIKWADKTETRVRPESDTVPNQYVGFVTAYAKKAAGNTSRINSLFDKWAIKKPIKDEIAEEKRIAEETETKRILEKRKAKREKWLIRKEALRIKREYEAKKLAQEKYGVPMDETIADKKDI